jgi:hypothetical protein
MTTPDPIPTSPEPLKPFYSVTITKAAVKGEPREDMPVGYEVRGYAEALPVAGESWMVLRTHRQGEEKLGVFTTSLVQTVVHDAANRTVLAHTRNSLYRIVYTMTTEAIV